MTRSNELLRTLLEMTRDMLCELKPPDKVSPEFSLGFHRARLDALSRVTDLQDAIDKFNRS